MLNKDTVFQMLRFGITGATATVVHYGVYYLLMNVINISVAFSVGYLVSFVLNYFMSARFTFRKKTSKKNGAGFCLAHLFNYLLQVSLLNVFVWLGLGRVFAPIPVYCISIPVNFLVVRFVFSRK